MGEGKPGTTQVRRFCAFAISHFFISVVSAPLGVLLFFGWVELLTTWRSWPGDCPRCCSGWAACGEPEITGRGRTG